MLKFEFTVDQVNAIIGALFKMPYEFSAPVIAEIEKQAKTQVNPQPVYNTSPPPFEENN
jgi:hypothetical protein